MRHTTCFDTIQPLIYHLRTALKPILCIVCGMTSYTTSQPLSISVNHHQRIAFRYSFGINIVIMRHTICFDTIQALIYNPAVLYHLSTFFYNQFLSYNFLYTTCISLKQMLCIFMCYNFLHDRPSLFQLRLNFISVLLLDIGLIETEME